MRIDVNVPDGKSGSWTVETFTVSEKEAKFETMRSMFSRSARPISAGTYKRLRRNGHVVMSNTPAEIWDHYEFIRIAKDSEHVLINGLGLGVALTKILESERVKSVTVIEISEDVINLVGPTFASDPRVKIIHADAFEWKPPKGMRYDCVWHDVWGDICSDNLPEISKLHRKYGRKADWQGSWCKELCKR